MASISSKRVIRRYYISCSIVLICYLAVLIPCILLYNNIWSIIFGAVLYLPVKLLVRIIANKTIVYVLVKQFDAIEFQKIIQQKPFFPSLDYRINAAMFTGDYQTVVNIANLQLTKKLSLRARYIYLCILAQVYFELRDFEKLQKILTEYDNYRSKHSSKSFLRQSYSVWSYYRYFLEHNYQACKVLCKERNLGITANSLNSEFLKLRNDFFYAIACYENQEFEEAEKIFKSIISRAPKMYVSNISEKYVVAIECNSDCPFATSNIIPDSNFQIYDSKTASRIKRNRMIIIIGLIIVAITTIVSSAFGAYDKKGIKAIDAYETKLNVALQAQYDEYNLVDYFNLLHNNDVTDVFCIVEDEKDQCDIGFIVTYDDGNTFDFICAVNDIKQGGRYVVKSPTGMHSVAIDIGLKSGTDYDNKVIIAFDSSKVSIGFAYLRNTDF